jgi:hypothetical protein
MPNSTVRYILSMTPASIDGVRIEVCAVDEYVHTDLGYLDLNPSSDVPTLLALVGVQSHQFQRSLDLAAFARAHGVRHCVIGGPHPMTCDTSMHWNLGVSFALSEAETSGCRFSKMRFAGSSSRYMAMTNAGPRKWTLRF